MQILNDIFVKPIGRPIDGVIKADDESSLRNEVEEYVLTREVSQRLEDFVSAYNDYNAATQNGVWISGFFGSGKSHLLKMLALLLENREIDGKNVLDMFLPKCNDEIFRAALRKACSRPSKSILFNIDQKTNAVTTRQNDALLSVFVKVFDDMCGYYGKQGYIAGFERDLDKRGLYGRFQEEYEKIARKDWRKGREQAILEERNIAKAYAAITGESEDSLSGIIKQYRLDYNLSIEDFAHEVKEYISRQPPGFRLNFFVDEVGQYIAENVKLMLNLQTIAETLATVCGGQAWLIVTAQEDMTSVLGEFGKKQGNDFSKIQARFANRLKLTSANVDEVIKKRLLEKRQEALPALEEIYDLQKNNFRTLFGFSGGTQYKQYADSVDFQSCYPFVPYQFPLFQTALEGLSAHNVFTGKHNSVGARSMLGVFQGVAVAIADREVGALASFELMYDGISQSVKSTATHAIRTAEQHLDNEDAVRVLKALFLVKYCRSFVASAHNLSVLLMSSFAENAESRQKRVQEALNRLESESYIQRDGEIYEYLTDEEQDVEREIKNTGIDSEDVTRELQRLLFEEILEGTKIRYADNGQDYTFGRMLDGHCFGSEKELAIHIITPWYERNTGEDFLTATWGKPELLMVMPPDSRFMSDLTLYLKTAKYIKQNSSTANDAVRRILDGKSVRSRDRAADIKTRAELLLAEADLIISGRKLEISGSNARQRMISAGQECIRYFYPNLKMLGSFNYQDVNIATYINENTIDLFPPELSESETELLNLVKSSHSCGLRMTIKALRDKLNVRPYGWYDAAILNLTARLAVRGKLDVRSDGNLLEGEKLIAALKNTSNHNNVTLEPCIDYTPAQIKRVRDFYLDYFQVPVDTADTKQLGREVLEKLRQLAEKLSTLADSRTNYPFLGEMLVPLQRLKTAAGKPAAYFFSEAPQSELSTLCDDKEDYIDPILAFMNGNGKKIFDDAKRLLREQDPNLGYVSHEETREMESIIRDPLCFKGKRMPRLKELTQTLSDRLTAALEQEKGAAMTRLEQLQAEFLAGPDFAVIDPVIREKLLSPFEQSVERLKSQNLIAVIREQLHTFETERAKELRAKLYLLAHPADSTSRPEEERKLKESIRMPKPPVSFAKPWLEDEADLDRYFEQLAAGLAQLKEQLRQEIRTGKRIQL